VLNYLPVLTLISLMSFPLIIKSGIGLQKNYDSVDDLVPYMTSTLKFSRLTGILFVIGFLIPL
jgi:1,4-dihydroxy-2-naphthoate octaprenyltransferase